MTDRLRIVTERETIAVLPGVRVDVTLFPDRPDWRQVVRGTVLRIDPKRKDGNPICVRLDHNPRFPAWWQMDRVQVVNGDNE